MLLYKLIVTFRLEQATLSSLANSGSIASFERFNMQKFDPFFSFVVPGEERRERERERKRDKGEESLKKCVPNDLELNLITKLCKLQMIVFIIKLYHKNYNLINSKSVIILLILPFQNKNLDMATPGPITLSGFCQNIHNVHP